MKISKGKAGAKPQPVYIEISIWKVGNTIHVAHNDPQGPSTFHVSIVQDGTKRSGHPKLYKELTNCLANLP